MPLKRWPACPCGQDFALHRLNDLCAITLKSPTQIADARRTLGIGTKIVGPLGIAQWHLTADEVARLRTYMEGDDRTCEQCGASFRTRRRDARCRRCQLRRVLKIYQAHEETR